MMNESITAALDSQIQQQPVCHVLLVEDNIIAAKVAQCILQSLHCRVDIAHQASEALERLGQRVYDIIFMDIGLPELDGFQLTKLIRQQAPPTQKMIPIIALSAHANITHRQEYHDLLMSGAIVKPLTREKAAEVLLAVNASPGFHLQQDDSTIISSLSDKVDLDALAVIDLDIVKKYISPDPIVFLPLLSAFLDGLHEQGGAVAEAFKRADWAALGAAAHKLSGAASYYGACQLRAVCDQLQHLSMETPAVQVAPKFQQLQQALVNLADYQIDANLHRSLKM